jgi:hypothetical protein
MRVIKSLIIIHNKVDIDFIRIKNRQEKKDSSFFRLISHIFSLSNQCTIILLEKTIEISVIVLRKTLH